MIYFPWNAKEDILKTTLFQTKVDYKCSISIMTAELYCHINILNFHLLCSTEKRTFGELSL